MHSLSEEMVVDVAKSSKDLASVGNGSDWSTFGVPEETAEEKADATDCQISCDLFRLRDLLEDMVVTDL